MEELSVPAIARAGTGVIYAYFPRSADAQNWLQQANARHRSAVIQFASDAARARYDLWPKPGSDFAIMKRVKQLFDPDALLNRGRLYRRL
jgi:FAD/FMN-containing dehydrogenase